MELTQNYEKTLEDDFCDCQGDASCHLCDLDEMCGCAFDHTCEFCENY